MWSRFGQGLEGDEALAEGTERFSDEYKYLGDKEKEMSRALYLSCFPEDSESFVSYYYREKTKDNRILVKKRISGESEELLSMVHCNPYRIKIKDKVYNLDYLVAVATNPDHRREGHMKTMLEKLSEDMRQDSVPLTYLVPVNPKVYEPLGFSFIADKPEYRLNPRGTALKRRACRDTDGDCKQAAEFMTLWLSERYEMHTVRDKAYVSRFLKELAAENGSLDFLFDSESLVGIQAYWGQESREQRLLYAYDEYTEQIGTKPWNMAKITNLSRLFELFSIREDSTAGKFLSECTSKQVLDFLFSYRNSDEIWDKIKPEIRTELSEISVVKSVLLDEIV